MASKNPRGATIGDIEVVLDRLAPPKLAQSWDNVGLLAGDRKASCRKVLLCIDLTPAVLAEAIEGKYDLLFAYHPPLFRPVSRLLADTGGTEALVYRAIAAGIALYSSHTALDAAPGGTNDVLADMCGLSDVQPFEFVSPGPSRCKIVTFVPQARLELVSQAMFAAGAGRIGDYEQCSYRLEGRGTFFGTENTNPRLGRKGRLETVAEVRLEVIAPQSKLPEVVAALRRSHPYEEPAFDVYPLIGEPVAGIGRVGQLPPGTTLGKLLARLARTTGSKVATCAGPAGTVVRRAAVCVGAAGRLPFEKQRAAGADVIVTGEIRHHDALAILCAGKTAIALGHWESERPVLQPMARRLAEELPSLRITVSRRDTSPFQR
ncbi:MAG TPA: Nif3-like dinuclear metal center hexameric protein [Phycisphaerae bacterium]|nr:Nif3-like dinuclear metal center hexameric protein [Phycisphaerae bacterium]